MEKNYRIKTDISNESVINVKLQQDVKTLEILSLNLTEQNYYKLHESSYGIIIGRVLANDAFGVPNVKVSIFIKLDNNDLTNSDIINLYPYTSVQSFDKDYRKYNLLPDESDDDCYRVIGTFPNKRLVLDNDTVLDVYDKYWKYTTVTNNAGDYMIFGVPTGNQTIHIDLDLSDIGVLSQRPRDMLYKGYNIEQFDSPNQFKESTNLNNLSQIISQNQAVYVYPFWGDANSGEIAISRCDINVDYKFEPTCVFMGALVTDNSNQQLSHRCTPTKYAGFNRNLTAGEGTIEMIRKTIDGLVEDFQIKGNRLIDSDGVWCYQIPMNLDYVQTDEYGNIVPTDNPNKGIPTRSRVRFRISYGIDTEGASKHRAKYLVPNNPELRNDVIEPTIIKPGSYNEGYFEFGSSTPDFCYRNLYWNKVYSVKSFIPRLQTTNKKGTQLYTGIRTTNDNGSVNPFPFNSARFKIFFTYRIICLLVTFIVYIVWMINTFISAFDAIGITLINLGKALKKTFILYPIGAAFVTLGKLFCVGCISFEAGLTDSDDSTTVYYPGCSSSAMKECTDCDIENCIKSNNTKELTDVIQENLSQEFDTVNLDFYNDWINGCLYFPIWYWKKTKKKRYLFGLFSKRAVNTFCDCRNSYNKLKNGYLCALRRRFNKNTYSNEDANNGSVGGWHYEYRNYRNAKYGVIKEKTNKDGLNIYYYTHGNVLDSTYLNRPDVDFPYMRLFSTDLILLGSFNDCDIDGIPKLFRYIPPTTANVPFLTKVTEAKTNDDDNNAEEGGRKDNGTIVISGMDWLYSGGDISIQNPLYSAGLLLDLSCTFIDTSIKSLVNLERMSELGVTLDMSYSLPYNQNVTVNGKIPVYDILPDGMITRYEINDNDSRCMFASLNHLGLDKLVRDEKTNYDVYKLGQVYPMDFDGAISGIARTYTKSASQKTYDNQDANYVKFRLGENRHAYMNDTNITYYPLYNNSFYFYFGVNEGNTAIDKFRSQYDTECFKNEKFPFTIEYSTYNATWCTHISDIVGDYAAIKVELSKVSLPISFSLENDNGKTLFSGTNINSTKLYFGFQEDISNKTEEEIANCKHGQKMYINGETIDILDSSEYLVNGTYKLYITDSKNKTMVTSIDILPMALDVVYDKVDLSSKYYGPDVTELKDICNEDELFGEIVFKEIYVDGYEYYITNDGAKKIVPITQRVNGVEKKGYKIYVLRADGGTKPHAEECLFLYFDVDSISDSQGNAFELWLNDDVKDEKHNCGCQGINTDPQGYNDQIQIPEIVHDTTVYKRENGTTKSELHFKVWIPSNYKFTFIEYCNGELTSNIYSQIVTIANGKPFTVQLDEMPLLFMISGGTTGNSFTSTYEEKNDGISETIKGQTVKRHLFYHTNMQVNKQVRDYTSWFNIHKIDCRSIGKDRNNTYNKGLDNCLYYLPDYTEKDKLAIYDDYINDIDKDDNKMITENGIYSISQFILNAVFKLSDATYVVDDDGNTHNLSINGGKAPYLIRTFKPQYSQITGSTDFHKWYVDSYGTSSANIDYSDIVSGNSQYKEEEDDVNKESVVFEGTKNIFVDKYRDNYYLSTYFAVFTNCGGYNIEKKAFEPTKGIVRLPYNTKPFSGETVAAINPYVVDKNVDFNGTYAKHVTGNNNKNNSYFPAPFIDRRFDYDMCVYVIPSPPKSFTSCSVLSQVMLLHGQVVNGIEMSYDKENDYNIITTANNDASLEYNHTRKIKGDKYNTQYYYVGGSSKYFPKYYETLCNDNDITSMFTSDFHKNFGVDINNVDTTKLCPIKESALHYERGKWLYDDADCTNPDLSKRPYNGKFGSSNYPSKRLLNITLPTSAMLSFSNASCSYNMTITESEGELIAHTKSGEAVSFDVGTKEIVKILSSEITNAVDTSDYNLLFYGNGSQTKLYHTRLSCKTIEDSNSQGLTVTTPLKFIMFKKPTVKNKTVLDWISGIVYKNPNDYVCNDMDAINLVDGVSFKNDSSITFKNNQKFFTEQCLCDSNNKPVYDSSDASLNAIHIIKNSIKRTMITSNNAANGYNQQEGYAPSNSGFDSDLRYLAIACLRKYISDNDTLKHSVEVMCVPLLLDIAKTEITYQSRILTGFTTIVIGEGSGSIPSTEGSSQEGGENNNQGSGTVNVETSGSVKYMVTVATVQFGVSSDNVSAESIIKSAKGKIKNQVYNTTYKSTKEKITTNGNTCTIYLEYDDVRLTETEREAQSLWQEIYIKTNDDLIYCFTYQRPIITLDTISNISPFNTFDEDTEKIMDDK